MLSFATQFAMRVTSQNVSFVDHLIDGREKGQEPKSTSKAVDLGRYPFQQRASGL